MPARMVTWGRACNAPVELPLCFLKETATPAEVDAAWNAWVADAVRMQHRIYGMAIAEESIDAEVYQVRRHFQLWGLPWSDRSEPSAGDGHSWVRSGR